MSLKKTIAAGAATLCLSVMASAALADDHAYTEGTVSQVSAIRTVDGHFDEYMTWIDTVWKKEQEAAKKAGYIVGYDVYQAYPRSENDADLYLVITYKNFAALDDGLAKSDAIAKQIEGSVAASNQSQADRSKIRRVLGTETIQTLSLK
jgi:crotonobetainyl-CoA:carnitine CoA-transferase CaiB-like acyl-CoA transferase